MNNIQIILRGPPGCGKSIMLRLIKNFLTSKGLVTTYGSNNNSKKYIEHTMFVSVDNKTIEIMQKAYYD